MKAFDVIPTARVVPAPRKGIICERELSDGIRPSATCGDDSRKTETSTIAI
jgi:hypothetical protein